jgi:hypothetical protein
MSCDYSASSNPVKRSRSNWIIDEWAWSKLFPCAWENRTKVCRVSFYCQRSKKLLGSLYFRLTFIERLLDDRVCYSLYFHTRNPWPVASPGLTSGTSSRVDWCHSIMELSLYAVSQAPISSPVLNRHPYISVIEFWVDPSSPAAVSWTKNATFVVPLRRSKVLPSCKLRLNSRAPVLVTSVK